MIPIMIAFTRPSPFRARGILLLGLLLTGCGEGRPEALPRQLSESPFHFPQELWDAGVEGETVLELHLSELGQVDSVHVNSPSGYAAFDSAAVRGARDLRFEPARRGGETVAVRVLLPVQFHFPAADAPDTPASENESGPTGDP